MSCCPYIKYWFINHYVRVEWNGLCKLSYLWIAAQSCHLCSVLSVFMQLALAYAYQPQTCLYIFFLNGCFNVFCMTLMTIVKINIKKDIQRSKLRIAMRVLSWIICCLRAAFWNFTEVSASLYSAMCHINEYLFLAFNYYRENSLDSTLCEKTRLIRACSSK